MSGRLRSLSRSATLKRRETKGKGMSAVAGNGGKRGGEGAGCWRQGSGSDVPETQVDQTAARHHASNTLAWFFHIFRRLTRARQVFRPNEDVDISGDHGDYHVAWIREGEFLRYTVNVEEAGEKRKVLCFLRLCPELVFDLSLRQDSFVSKIYLFAKRVKFGEGASRVV